jgi:hypothetical protein
MIAAGGHLDARADGIGTGSWHPTSGPVVDFHHAEPTGSRGLHSAVGAEGGNIDAGLAENLQNGPAIFTADFPVIYGETAHVAFLTCNKL